MDNHQLIHSSESTEWNTPSRYLEAARQVLGAIDLDPATTEMANRGVKAASIFTQADDGLRQRWFGRVWLNPPYGRGGQSDWSRKLIGEYDAGRVAAAILLVNAATCEKWFQPLWRFAVCLTDHRIRFLRPDGGLGPSPTHGNSFTYFGPEPERFAEEFMRFGRIVPAVAAAA